MITRTPGGFNPAAAKGYDRKIQCTGNTFVDSSFQLPDCIRKDLDVKDRDKGSAIPTLLRFVSDRTHFCPLACCGQETLPVSSLGNLILSFIKFARFNSCRSGSPSDFVNRQPRRRPNIQCSRNQEHIGSRDHKNRLKFPTVSVNSRKWILHKAPSANR